MMISQWSRLLNKEGNFESTIFYFLRIAILLKCSLYLQITIPVLHLWVTYVNKPYTASILPFSVTH